MPTPSSASSPDVLEAAQVANTPKRRRLPSFRTSLAFGIVLLVLAVILGSWFTVDQGERGVVLRNGAMIGTAEPGLGFKIPFIDTVVKISTQTRIISYEAVPAYSRDQQPAVMRVSVNYHLQPDQVQAIYARFGSENAVVSRLITPQVNEELKTVFGQFNAETAIRERARLNLEVATAVARAVDGPVVIEGVQIENIDFSDAFEQAVEERAKAEVEVSRFRQNAEREKVQAQIVGTQAVAKADAVRAAAMAESEAIKLRGEAEATAIRARGDALRDNPGLVGLVQAERWNGVLPTTMLPGAAVPMLQLDR